MQKFFCCLFAHKFWCYTTRFAGKPLARLDCAWKPLQGTCVIPKCWDCCLVYPMKPREPTEEMRFLRTHRETKQQPHRGDGVSWDLLYGFSKKSSVVIPWNPVPSVGSQKRCINSSTSFIRELCGFFVWGQGSGDNAAERVMWHMWISRGSQMQDSFHTWLLLRKKKEPKSLFSHSADRYSMTSFRMGWLELVGSLKL